MVVKNVNLVVFSCLIWCVCTVHACFFSVDSRRFSLKWPSMPPQNDRLHNLVIILVHFCYSLISLFLYFFTRFVLLFAFQPIYCKRAPCCIYTSFHLIKLKKKKNETHNIGINISFSLFNKC